MSEQSKTRVVVIGVGSMGRNHARVYREIPQAQLLAVADTNRQAAESIAAHHGTRAYVDYRQMLETEQPDAVSIAVPTQLHHQVVLDSLRVGCHVLVEKPIAATIEEASDLIAAAQAAGRVLMVGHVERYNPAILELKRRLDAGEAGRVFQINARRLGPFPARIRDVGVVIDLATHDLDIMRYLIGALPIRLFAETRRNIHTSREDMLAGFVVFESGALGLLEINWLTPTKIRELAVTAERGMFLANYLTQDLFFYENAAVNGQTWNQLMNLRGVSEGTMTRFAVKKNEPLRAELEAFIGAVQGIPERIVTGEDGLAALAMAVSLIRSGESREVVTDLGLLGGRHPPSRMPAIT